VSHVSSFTEPNQRALPIIESYSEIKTKEQEVKTTCPGSYNQKVKGSFEPTWSLVETTVLSCLCEIYIEEKKRLDIATSIRNY
jgi:hypothetical protein